MRGRDQKQRKQGRQQPRQPQKDAGVAEKLAALLSKLAGGAEKKDDRKR